VRTNGCAYGMVLAGLLWVVIFVVAAVVLSRVLP
jgi:tetrahydromethanopterin S-methyltransferase subunit F